MTHVKDDIYSCQVPVDIPNIIFNNGNTQTDDLVLPDLASGKNLYDYFLGTWSVYTDAPNAGPDVEPDVEPTTPNATEPQATEPQGSTDSKDEPIVNPILWIAIGAVVLAAAVVVVIIILKKKA